MIKLNNKKVFTKLKLIAKFLKYFLNFCFCFSFSKRTVVKYDQFTSVLSFCFFSLIAARATNDTSFKKMIRPEICMLLACTSSVYYVSLASF